MVQEREDVVALDTAIILNPRVWEASGHVAGFTDPLVDCRTCKLRFRADHLADPEHEEVRCGKRPSKRPGEIPDCDLTEPRQFNLMFETTIGPVQETGAKAYLRPETARGSSSTSRMWRSWPGESHHSGSRTSAASPSETRSRRELPLPRAGVRADGDGVLRPAGRAAARSLPGSTSAWAGTSATGCAKATCAFASTLPRSCRTTRAPRAISNTSTRSVWSELEGIANRGDFDLTRHAEHSGPRARVGGRRNRRAFRPARDRASGEHRPDAARVPDRRVQRGGRRGARAHGPFAFPPRSRRSRLPVPLIGKNADMVSTARSLFEELRVDACLRSSTTTAADRPALPAAGRDRHAVRVHG